METRQTRVDSRSQNGCKKKHLTSFRGQLAVSENNSGLPTRRLSSSESKFSGDGGETRGRGYSEVLLSSLLGIHGVQDGLPFGGVALPELLDLPLHHGIQGGQTQLQLLEVQVLQLQTNNNGEGMSLI